MPTAAARRSGHGLMWCVPLPPRRWVRGQGGHTGFFEGRAFCIGKGPSLPACQVACGPYRKEEPHGELIITNDALHCHHPPGVHQQRRFGLQPAHGRPAKSSIEEVLQLAERLEAGRGGTAAGRRPGAGA